MPFSEMTLVKTFGDNYAVVCGSRGDCPVRQTRIEAAFEEAVRGVILAASTFPGYVGGEVLYPETKRGEWQLILRFDSFTHLQEWEQSPICQGWIARADGLSVGAPNVVRVNGLEAWFALPSVPNTLPPPKWKTAIVSTIGIYPNYFSDADPTKADHKWNPCLVSDNFQYFNHDAVDDLGRYASSHAVV